MNTADTERRLREKNVTFVLKEHHASGKPEAWKFFPLIIEKRGDDNELVELKYVQ